MARGKKAPKKKEVEKSEVVEDEASEELVTEEKMPIAKRTKRATKEEAEKEELEVEAEEKEEEEVTEEAEAKGAKKEAEPSAEAEAEEEDLEIVEEKFYDLNMRKIWNAPRKKRTPRAVRYLREFIAHRMKTDEVSISEETNNLLWTRGISKPPRKIRVRAVKDKEGRVIVFPGEGK